MIVCPQCEFENPISNRFCQQCGAALERWRAFVVWGPSSTFELGQAPTALGISAGQSPAPTPLPALPKGSYLDLEQRYQLLQELSFQAGQGTAAIADHHAGTAPSLLERYSRLRAKTGQAEAAAAGEQLPAMAYPYLVLQERFFPAIPEIQAAWSAPDYHVIIIEDRTDLPTLLDTWTDLMPLQQVHCLYAMVELWEALAALNSQGSLLRLDNLCIDEDQIFCLRRIDPDTGHRPLMDLGLLWQSLLAVSQPQDALATLTAKIIAGEQDQIAAIKDELVAIADDLQPSEVNYPDIDSGLDPNPDLASDLASADDDLDPALLARLAIAPDEVPEAAPDPLAGLASPAADSTAGEAPDLPTMVLPMKLIGIEEAGLTHVGQQRDHNEDAYFIQSELRKQDGLRGQKLEAQCLYVLCDGMGGHAGGEVASALAVQTLQDYFTRHWQVDLPAEAQIREAISQANQAIFDRNEAEARSGAARMGTTLVLVLLSDTQAAVAHVGDSRLYRYTRRLGLQQMTVDHEVGQREIQRGVEAAIAYARPDAYQLTQALGPRGNSELNPTVTYLNFTEDTLLLLCSDGLSDHDLLETHCSSHVDPVLRGPKNIEEGVAELIELANDINGHDNITAVAVKVKVKPNLEQASPY